MRGQRGFTLLELVVVIVLIGVTMAFAVPRLDLFSVTDTLKQSGRKLTQLILKTSSLAASTTSPYLLRYESGIRRFTVVAFDEDGQETALEEHRLPDDVSVLDFTSPFRDIQATGTMELLINKDGYLEPSLIHLQGEEGRTMTLKLSPFLSTISIHDGYLQLDEGTFL